MCLVYLIILNTYIIHHRNKQLIENEVCIVKTISIDGTYNFVVNSTKWRGYFFLMNLQLAIHVFQLFGGILKSIGRSGGLASYT